MTRGAQLGLADLSFWLSPTGDGGIQKGAIEKPVQWAMIQARMN
jgi:hypothetical protein